MAKEKVIVITTTNTVYVRELERKDNGLMNDDLQEIVGGYIEIVHPAHLESPYVLVCNDEGKILDLPRNRACSLLYGYAEHGIPMEGNIILMKEGFYEGEPDIIGLTDEEIPMLTLMLLRQFSFLKKGIRP